MNCFAIVAGRNTTTDGSVLFAHNEDDGGEQMLNLYIVPRSAENGTQKYLWAEFPGMSVADSYMNESGVCIASDGCSSCEDRDDFTDGGVLYEVRQIVAQKAISARHAVHLIGQMVEQYGYRGSGRTYAIVDPYEGWICSVVKGRHWVAQRVPDDMVMTIPNYYTITSVNLADTLNFLGSSDIISYAEERGWYNPQTDGEFNFRKAYHASVTFERESNAWRHKAVLDYLVNGDFPYSVEDVQPMVRPARKVSLEDMMNMLALHRETGKIGHPANVCTSVTILATVFQLNANLPREYGCVMWNCPGHPCAEMFIPWHIGMDVTPDNWHRYITAMEAQEKHFSEATDKRELHPKAACWSYVDRWQIVENNYEAESAKRLAAKKVNQPKLIALEKRLQEHLKTASADKISAREMQFTKKALRISRK